MKQFVYLGGMNFRKRLDVLIKGFSVFVTRYPDHRLVLIGSNYGSIANMVKELDLQDKVVLTGYVSHREKFEILKASIAIVYPSLYEGYGMAIAEGMQAGIPVIAGTGGSQLEVGGDGVRRIDPTSPESVTAAMEEVLDPIVRAHWVQRGREQLGRLTSPDIERNLVRFFVEQATMARKRTTINVRSVAALAPIFINARPRLGSRRYYSLDCATYLSFGWHVVLSPE